MPHQKKIIFLFFLGIFASAIIYLFSIREEKSPLQSDLTDQSGEIKALEAKAAISDDLTDLILSDHKNLIPTEFQSSPYFKPFVRFWFGIYTRYDSKQVVIHDKDNLGLVYNVLDFSMLSQSSLNRYAQSAILQKIVSEKISELKASLKELSLGQTSSGQSIAILKLLDINGVVIPTNSADRKKFFEYRLENIRTQTGQRDAIFAGLGRMLPYSVFLKTIFEEFGLPIQLSAIPFLESSFNNVAESKVGALGIWQFMPHIGNHFMPKRTDLYDYRSNPFIASVGALHLLKENYKILKNWDLAVTAYNSGTKHLVKARKDLGINHLDEILSQYDHPHIGFASKNFYAEFVALVYTLAYKDSIFPPLEYSSIYDPSTLKIGPLKCKLDLKFLKKKLKEGDWSRFVELNPHILKLKSTLPRGTLIVSDIAETNKMVLALSPREWAKKIPNQWDKAYLKRNHSCSTR